CDSYRPCSLCTRANARCVSDGASGESRPQKDTGVGGSSLDSPATVRPRATKKRRTLDHEAEEPHWPDATRALSNVHSASPASETPRARSYSHHTHTDYGEAEPTIGIARQIYGLGQQNIDEDAVNAIPGAGQTPSGNSTNSERHPIQSYLRFGLPPKDIILSLLAEYFESVHWFSLVVYEPKFHETFLTIQDGFAEPSLKPYLVTLSVMLGLAAWYKSHKLGTVNPSLGKSWQDWSSRLIGNAELEMLELMDQNSIPATQTLILLGSFYVYHGKPNLSFSLLGASIKAAQALGLHREYSPSSFHDSEERKRVWWTIYTWDRFAAITYGRPVGINDEDCNVTMPLDFNEAIHFDEASHADEESRICFSPYQRELNKLYMIASPVIQTVYGNRLRRKHRGAERDAYLQLVQDVTGRLWEWQQSLPPHLLMNLSQDCPANMTATAKAHVLQSLALQLTFDNLLIIIHRPFLSQQIDTLREGCTPPSASNDPYPLDSNSRRTSTSCPASPLSSPRQWWDAAVRTARVTELPQLAQLATDSHLVAFLAINLFNSAIVMVVMALGAPLSDKAQEVKRTITRVFRLQQAFGRRSKLSTQSSVVLRNVIQLLLRREADAILTPVGGTSTRAGTNNDSASPGKRSISIKETLNMPLGHPMSFESQGVENESFNYTNGQLSYDESLASVQRAFSGGLDGSNRTTVPLSHPTPDFHDSQPAAIPMNNFESHDWASTEYQPPGPNTMSNSLTGVDDSSAGVYWFWNTVWNENPFHEDNGSTNLEGS
ncbi:hypothetical protein FJTKL_07204, partial [Diaporthe vaccinii]